MSPQHVMPKRTLARCVGGSGSNPARLPRQTLPRGRRELASFTASPTAFRRFEFQVDDLGVLGRGSWPWRGVMGCGPEKELLLRLAQSPGPTRQGLKTGKPPRRRPALGVDLTTRGFCRSRVARSCPLDWSPKNESPSRRRALARPMQEAPRIEGCSASSLRPEPSARCTLMRQTCYSPYLVESPLRLNGIGKINALSRAANVLSGKAAFVAPEIGNPSN